MSEISAVVKAVDSHLCGWGSISNKSCSFSYSLISLCFLCSEQHVKYRMPRGFPLTSSLLLDYHFKQNVHTKDLTNVLVYVVYCSEGSCGKVKNKNKKMNVSSFGNKGLTVDFYLGRVPKYYSI